MLTTHGSASLDWTAWTRCRSSRPLLANGSSARSTVPRRHRSRAGPRSPAATHTLIQAPTGSGKTLAAFLYGIDRLTAEPGEGLRLLYVSPLKALNYDIERNLRGPLAGLQSELRVAVRTGDTSAEGARGDAPGAIPTS